MTSELDIVVFGATGFVGRLVAGTRRARPADVRIGLAGRSRAARRRPRRPWPEGRVLAADRRRHAYPASLPALAESTRVVATTVGPSCVTASRWSRPAPAPAPTTPTSPARSCSCGEHRPSTISRRPAAPESCTRAASTRSRPTSASCCCTSGPAPMPRATRGHDAAGDRREGWPQRRHHRLGAGANRGHTGRSALSRLLADPTA